MPKDCKLKGLCIMIRVLSFLSLLCFLTRFTEVTSDPFANICTNTTTYTPNSTFKSNLEALFSVLSSNATTTNGFYNSTANGGGNSSDVVYGLFLCRGDVSADVCQDCVTTASQNIVQLCPKQRQAIVWYDNCLLRYSNQYIFSVLDQSVEADMYNQQNITELNRFRQVLGETMDDVATRAAKGESGKKFATKETNLTARQKLYGLAQCTPDISTSGCDTCLRDAISILPSCCDGRQGGRVLFPSCNVRYELYPFYTAAATSVPPPPAVLPPSPIPASSPGNGGISSKVLIAIIVPIVVAVLLFVMGFCFLRRKAKKKYDSVQQDTIENEFTTADSLRYDLITIQSATNNFSDGNKVGEGGFGDVYKGTLPNGQEIAMKRLSRNSGQGAEEFKNEVVLVAKLEHRNLVRLLGFCLEGEEKILIYEYVPNKSLDYFLFDPGKQEKLDWTGRYKIIGGIARGILYLHEDSRLKIIHRDLKTSNILLDRDMNAKISDFGMARIFGMDQTEGNTSRVVGTYGYISPEYAMQGQFSVKSDVFSFGVLLLEITSGKRNNDFYQSDCAEDLLSHAWKLWRDGRSLELMDPVLEGSYSRDEAMRCIHIGLLCVNDDPDERPSMAAVVVMLSSYSVALSVPQQPAFFPCSIASSNAPQGLESDQSTGKSVNKVSITELQPR